MIFEPGLACASAAQIKEMLDAWQAGHSLADVLGLEEATGAAWSHEQPAVIRMADLVRMFGTQITPANVQLCANPPVGQPHSGLDGGMALAAYDGIADWYETRFLAAQGTADPLGIGAAIDTLLGPGTGPVLEIGCGTGAHAARVRALGRTPLGLDLSAGMLRHAVGRLPVGRADALRLPVRSASLGAVLSVMVHTDMPAYRDVLREVARVLRPGGVFVHIGVHPCFCGGFADHTDPAAVVVRPGYLEQHWTSASWTDQGVRDKVGAAHWPLPDLLHAFLDAGLTLDRFTEGGAPTPIVLAVRTVLSG